MKYERFAKLKAFRYQIPELIKVVDELDSPVYKTLKQVNLIDVLIRKVHSLDLREISLLLIRLNQTGGFIKANDFLCVMQFLRKIIANYEYYRTWPFEKNNQCSSYVNVVAFFVKEFINKFRNEKKVAEFASEFVGRSGIFWSEQLRSFPMEQKLWLCKSIGNLNIVTPVECINKITAELIKDIPEIMSLTSRKDLKNALDMNKVLRILNENQIEQLKQKLTQNS